MVQATSWPELAEAGRGTYRAGGVKLSEAYPDECQEAIGPFRIRPGLGLSYRRLRKTVAAQLLGPSPASEASPTEILAAIWAILTWRFQNLLVGA